MARRTQNERIMSRLRLGGMCGIEPHGWSPPIHRPGARVYDLRAEGHPIASLLTCPEHDGAKHAYYTLVNVTTQAPTQQSMFEETR